MINWTPLILMASIALIRIGAALVKHGQVKEHKENVFSAAIAYIIWFELIYWVIKDCI